MGFPIPNRVGSWLIDFARAGGRVARGAQSYSENWYLKHKKKERIEPKSYPLSLSSLLVQHTR